MERESYYLDDIFGERLLISNQADARELGSNVRAARAILNSFPEVYITIRPHRIHLHTKNPEYTICEQIGDRKGNRARTKPVVKKAAIHWNAAKSRTAAELEVIAPICNSHPLMQIYAILFTYSEKSE